MILLKPPTEVHPDLNKVVEEDDSMSYFEKLAAEA